MQEALNQGLRGERWGVQGGAGLLHLTELRDWLLGEERKAQ